MQPHPFAGRIGVGLTIETTPFYMPSCSNYWVLSVDSRQVEQEDSRKLWCIYQEVRECGISRHIIHIHCAGKVLENRSWLSVDGIVDLFWAFINFFVLL